MIAAVWVNFLRNCVVLTVCLILIGESGLGVLGGFVLLGLGTGIRKDGVETNRFVVVY
jgi:hypothetical protein